MNILFIGDVVGKAGRNVTKYMIERLSLDEDIDFIIANLENATHGKGLNRSHFLSMLEAGVDVATLGNHFMSKKDIVNYIDDYDNILRPGNLPDNYLGHGSDVYECNGLNIRVTNMMGKAFMREENLNPFDYLDSIVKNDDADLHIVDFHAEATGEKQAVAWAFDGKITALIGTHTHVQTNDARLLKQGTFFMSDVGMCGPYNGILGTKREAVIARSWKGEQAVFDVQEDDEYIFSAVLLTINENTKKVEKYRPIYKVLKKQEVNNG